MPKGRPLRRKNGNGSVIKLSGRRREPYEVRVNTRMDDRYYPIYDVLGRFADRTVAEQALADYQRNPYDISTDKITFAEVYEKWFGRKFQKGKKQLSKSSEACYKGAFAKCSALHKMKFKEIRTLHMQEILDNHDLSHAYMEHILNLFKQMFKFALEFDIVQKNYATFVIITKDEDDESGEPFTKKELELLWQNKDKPFVDSVLVFIYTGWRVSELLSMQREFIDLKARTMTGGAKTVAGKDRVVPIHSKIFKFVEKHMKDGHPVLFGTEQRTISSKQSYYPYFQRALLDACITTKHTPHDCRHTFATLLNNAGANPVCVKRLMGHSSGSDVTEKVYTHKDVEELRKAIELI